MGLDSCWPHDLLDPSQACKGLWNLSLRDHHGRQERAREVHRVDRILQGLLEGPSEEWNRTQVLMVRLLPLCVRLDHEEDRVAVTLDALVQLRSVEPLVCQDAKRGRKEVASVDDRRLLGI